MSDGGFPLPRIFDCSRFYVAEPITSFSIGRRNTLHYELDYNISGDRTILVDDNEYRVSDGYVVFRKPGQTAASIGYYNMYMLTLGYDAEDGVNVRERRCDNQAEPINGSYFWNLIPTCFRPKHHAEIFAIYRRLSILWQQPGRADEAELLLSQLIFQIIADALDYRTEKTVPSAVDLLLEYMYDHYSEKIRLDELSELVHLNKSYLIRLFHREVGSTPLDYLTRLRLEQSCRLLETTALKISEISYRCGFDSASYYIRRFHDTYAQTPEQYREQYRLKTSEAAENIRSV